MIPKSKSNNKCLTSIESIFEALNFKALLSLFHFTRCSGADAFSIISMVFYIAFLGKKNLYRLAQSRHFKDFNVDKDAIYGFLKKKTLNWHGLHLAAAKKAYDKMVKCNKPDHIYTLIGDDTPIERCHVKKVEGVSRVYNHVEGRNMIGYLQVQVGVTDGNDYIPTYNQLTASSKMICEPSKDFDQRTCGAQLREDLLKSKPEVLLKACMATLAKGIYATHILLDSWYYSDDIIGKFKIST